VIIPDSFTLIQVAQYIYNNIHIIHVYMSVIQRVILFTYN